MEWNKLADIKKFLEFGKLTHPDKIGVVKNWSKEIKAPLDVVKILKRLKVVDIPESTTPIISIDEMVKKKIIGACSEFSILSASILKTAKIPTGIIGAIKIDSLYDKKKYHTDNTANHLLNVVFWKGEWYLLDPSSGLFSKDKFFCLLNQDLFPCKIWYTDFSEEGLKNRVDTYNSMVKKVSKIFGFEYQKDILHPKILEIEHEDRL